MTRSTAAVVTVLVPAAVFALVAGRPAATSVDAAFAAFFDASGPQAAAMAAASVVRSGVPFAEAVGRLKRGRQYSAEVQRGVVTQVRRAPNGDFPYTLDVPPDYDPARRYQVRLQLHGGVGRPLPALRGDGSIGALAGREQIYVLPQSWVGAPWWTPSQLENLRAILDRVKRTYNIDENRVALAGVSDGGTAVFYVAMRDTTPYASFLPMIGSIMVLGSDLGLDGDLFPNNLRNKPFFVVNAGKDRLYPAARVEPVLDHFKAGGLSLAYHPQPEGGHNTAWWPDVKEAFETFVAAHPREPHPSVLTWRTDDTASGNRAHWLVIDRLGAEVPAGALPDLNQFSAGPGPQLGLRAAGMRVTSVLPGSNAETFGFQPGDLVTSVNRRALPGGLDLNEFMGRYPAGASLTFVVSRQGRSVELSGVYQPSTGDRISPLFPPSRPSGRVDIIRDGNRIQATTRGVAAFTVLLSPDVFDFSERITIIADGTRVFDRRVEPSVDTLMKWAARDNDRTMLYGAQVAVTLPR